LLKRFVRVINATDELTRYLMLAEHFDGFDHRQTYESFAAPQLLTIVSTTSLFCAVDSPIPLIGERQLGIERNLTLQPKPDNPRNSEGDFIQLKDGR
jgi:hypothetical protein